jgi:hypothetical protein
MMSSRPSFASSSRSSGHQRQVAGGQRADADDMDVVLDRLAGGLLRRLEQRADIDVEAEVGEGGGDHLLAAVVAVLAHLGDQDARPPAFLFLELPRHRARDLVHRPDIPHLAAVDAGNRS